MMTAWLLNSFLWSMVVLAAALLFYLLARKASAALRHALLTAAFLTTLVLPFTRPLMPKLSFAAPVELPLLSPLFSGQAQVDHAAGREMPRGQGGYGLLAEIGLAIWAMGALFCLGRLGLGMWWLAGIRRRSQKVAQGDLLKVWRQVLQDSGGRGNMAVYMDQKTRMPLTSGLLRPFMILPEAAKSWDTPKLKMVLCHEATHLRRNDLQKKLLVELVCAFFWMNPLVWLTRRLFFLAQEQACDDQVLLTYGDAKTYAGHLLEIARSALMEPSGQRLAALGVAFHSELSHRVTAILDGRQGRKGAGGTHRHLHRLLAVLLFLPFLGLHCSGPNYDTPAFNRYSHSLVSLMVAQAGVGLSIFNLLSDDTLLIDMVNMVAGLDQGAQPAITQMVLYDRDKRFITAMDAGKGGNRRSFPSGIQWQVEDTKTERVIIAPVIDNELSDNRTVGYLEVHFSKRNFQGVSGTKESAHRFQ